MSASNASPPAPKPEVIAIIGAGSIGIAFAIVFARVGHAVRLQEPDPARREQARGQVLARLAELSGFDLLKEAPLIVASRIAYHAEIATAVDGAAYVQECAPEQLPLKRALFAELDRLAPSDAIFATASSALTASQIAADIAGRHRTLVAHPGNPPFLIPVIELVPAPFTSAAVTEHAAVLLKAAGLEPITLGREIEGFVFNRLQGALLREAYCLVRDGIASVTDIDRIVRDGLGLRWSVIGPFETVDLNTQGGIASHALKMGPAYARMGAERGQNDPWTDDLVARVSAERRAALPLADWSERVAWRDRSLMALVRHRQTETS
jgi:3-hydroxyacyl-CoA dehydrogenase